MPTWSYARPLHWGYPQGIVPEHPAAQKHSYAYHEPSARAVGPADAPPPPPAPSAPSPSSSSIGKKRDSPPAGPPALAARGAERQDAAGAAPPAESGARGLAMSERRDAAGAAPPAESPLVALFHRVRGFIIEKVRGCCAQYESTFSHVLHQVGDSIRHVSDDERVDMMSDWTNDLARFTRSTASPTVKTLTANLHEFMIRMYAYERVKGFDAVPLDEMGVPQLENASIGQVLFIVDMSMYRSEMDDFVRNIDKVRSIGRTRPSRIRFGCIAAEKIIPFQDSDAFKSSYSALSGTTGRDTNLEQALQSACDNVEWDALPAHRSNCIIVLTKSPHVTDSCIKYMYRLSRESIAAKIVKPLRSGYDFTPWAIVFNHLYSEHELSSTSTLATVLAS